MGLRILREGAIWRRTFGICIGVGLGGMGMEGEGEGERGSGGDGMGVDMRWYDGERFAQYRQREHSGQYVHISNQKAT